MRAALMPTTPPPITRISAGFTPGTRGYDAFNRAFNQGNLLTRVTGDTIALSPPLIVEKSHIDRIFETLADTLRATA